MRRRYGARLLLATAPAIIGGLVVPHRPVQSAIGASAPAAQTLLVASGDGITNTRSFQSPRDWRIAYSFNQCQIPGFSIYVKGGSNDLFSTQGNSGHGTEYVHGGGRVYLTLNTACNWHIAAYAGAPTVSGLGFTTSGNGIANTVKLRVPSEWRIIYSFNHCEVPGFAIYVKGDVFDIMSNERGSGKGIQYEHSGGTVYLTMNTACSWRVQISR